MGASRYPHLVAAGPMNHFVWTEAGSPHKVYYKSYEYIPSFVGPGTQSRGDFTLSSQFSLNVNHPNPFSNSTVINYSLRKPTYVLIKIYNANGNVVKTILNEYKDAGMHSIVWNGKDDYNNPLPNGVYICHLSCDGFILTKILTIMK